MTSKEFDFQGWISENGLQTIMTVFESHGATKPDTLQITSEPFQSVMQDHRLFVQPQMIPKILNAVQQIAVQSNPVRVIITEEEQLVIDNIHANLDKLKQIEDQTNGLKEKLPNSISRIKQEKLKQVATVIDKISNTFKKLSNKLNDQQSIFIKQLENIKANVSDDNSNDDEKEIDILTELQNTIRENREYLNEKIQKYDELTLSNDNREQRKIAIITMGKDIRNKFDETYQALIKNMNHINDCIAKNESMTVNIDFVVNEKQYNKISESIKVIGKVINKCYDSSTLQSVDQQEDDNKYDDLEDEHLKQLQLQLKSCKNTMLTLEQQLAAEKSKSAQLIRVNQSDQNRINTLNQQLTAEKTKFIQLDNANKTQQNTITALNQQLSTERSKITQLQQQINTLNTKLIPKINQSQNVEEKKENAPPLLKNINPTTLQRLKIKTENNIHFKIKKLTKNKFASIQRVNACIQHYYVRVFETSSNGKLIAQGDPITIPQPYQKCGGHNDIYIFNESTIITSTCPYDSSNGHKSFFTLLKVNGVKLKLEKQYDLKEPYIAMGADMCKIGYDRMILCDYDGRLKVLKISQDSIVDGKFYQLTNYERNSTIVKLSDAKLVRLSEIQSGKIQAAVISVNGMTVSEGTPYIIRNSAERYGRSMVALSSNKCLVTYRTKTKSYVSILSISGNKVIEERSIEASITLLKLGETIWYHSIPEIGTVEITANSIVLHKVAKMVHGHSLSNIIQISNTEFLASNKRGEYVIMNFK